MSRAALRGFCTIFALAALAGCETMQGQPPATETPDVGMQHVAAADSSARTIVWGQAADWQLGESSRLEAALNHYGIPRGQGESLRGWIQRIENQSTVLAGLGGPPAGQFLQAAKAMTKEPGQGGGYRPVPAGKRVQYTTVGQLVPAEYSYNENDGSGRLQVIMTTLRHVPGGPTIPAEAYRWTVNIKPGGFFEHLKDLQNPGNVFPNTPLAISAQQAAGFNYKLFAQGPDAIEIESIEVKQGNGQWTDLQPPNHPFYDVQSMSCIDIMFPGEPPDTLDAGAVPPLYCLGRCSSPPLVNTK